MKGQTVILKNGDTVQLLDKILIKQPVHKYQSQQHANRNGANFWDDENIINHISVTAYIGMLINSKHGKKEPFSVVRVFPEDIQSLDTP